MLKGYTTVPPDTGGRGGVLRVIPYAEDDLSQCGSEASSHRGAACVSGFPTMPSARLTMGLLCCCD